LVSVNRSIQTPKLDAFVEKFARLGGVELRPRR